MANIVETLIDMYISKPTRCTSSYNESILIIKRSTCFGLLSPSQTYGTGLYQLRYTASKNVAPDDGLKSPKHVAHLNVQ